jgi:hypothetical protein
MLLAEEAASETSRSSMGDLSPDLMIGPFDCSILDRGAPTPIFRSLDRSRHMPAFRSLAAERV